MNERQLEQALNERQCKAASTLNGPVLIIAGAGSGKTRMITYRIAYMLSSGIDQSRILALTFTNKAAKEMSERIRALTGKNLKKLTSSTFHAFGVKILRREIGRLGYDLNFTIYDQTDRNSLLKTVIRELKIPLEDVDLFELSALFSDIKTGRAQWKGDCSTHKKIFEEYKLHLKAYNAVDFDDLIMLPIALFKEHPDVLEKYRKRYQYIMVDEFQDTSLAQYEFVHLLAKEHRNICVVGDDDQSIYSWRGANYENIMNFEKDFPEVSEIRLEQNYRSTGTILQAANSLIANNTQRKDKQLWTGSDDGRSIILHYPEDDQQEADFICTKIKGLAFEHELNYDCFGVLVRTNSLLATLEQTFIQDQLPYSVSGGQSFFARKEIKDIIAYMRLLTNPDDNVNFLRIINTPRRGIGRVSLESLRTYAKSRRMSLFSAVSYIASDPDTKVRSSLKETCRSFTEMIELYKKQLFRKHNIARTVRNLISEIDYRGHLISEHPDNERLVQWKMKNVELFLNMIERWEKNPDNFDPNIYDYLNKITLITKDEDDKEQGKVHLMTIHASKGLEFDTVFLAGVEDHILPHARSIEEDADNLEEERRLFYVAITRAQKVLYMTSCRQRKVMREYIETSPSRFLEEIPQELIIGFEEDENEIEPEDAFAKMRARFGSS